MLFSSPRIALIAAAGLLMACDGALEIRLTDAPADTATNVTVRITAVELLGDNNTTAERFTLDPAREIDLSTLTEGRTVTLVTRDEFSAGTYRGVRLVIDADASEQDSTITFDDGGEFSLVLSSAAGGSPVASGDFSITDEETTRITVDFDLRRSVLQPTGVAEDYRLAPRLRLVNDADIGTLTGTVAEARITDGDCDNGANNDIGNVVYVFDDAGIVPNDLDNSADDAITSARVRLDETTGEFVYTAAFLPQGDYTVAFTCDGRIDDPETTDNAVAFTGTQNVAIRAGETATIDFD